MKRVPVGEGITGGKEAGEAVHKDIKVWTKAEKEIEEEVTNVVEEEKEAGEEVTGGEKEECYTIDLCGKPGTIVPEEVLEVEIEWFQEKVAPADGNCLFHSLVSQQPFPLSTLGGANFREQVMTYMVANVERYYLHGRRDTDRTSSKMYAFLSVVYCFY